MWTHLNTCSQERFVLCVLCRQTQRNKTLRTQSVSLSFRPPEFNRLVVNVSNKEAKEERKEERKCVRESEDSIHCHAEIRRLSAGTYSSASGLPCTFRSAASLFLSLEVTAMRAEPSLVHNEISEGTPEHPTANKWSTSGRPEGSFKNKQVHNYPPRGREYAILLTEGLCVS